MENKYWLSFASSSFLTYKEKLVLIKNFKNPLSMKFANSNDIVEKTKISYEKIEKLKNIQPAYKLEEYLLSNNIKFLAIDDSKYPKNLKNIYDPPIVIYYRGNFPKKVCTAIVGTRKATNNGLKNSEELAYRLAEKGYCIVSGLAKGVDTYAHRGALLSGSTIAVLGNGLNVVYPPENKIFYEIIAQKGCIISEYLPNAHPTRYTFPARNRIISGLSDAVIIVEAGEKSGALITADFALEQGKDVFAFANNTGEFAKGTNALIKDGAIPIYSIDEFIKIYT